MSLNPYMVSEGEPENGACLVFAHTAKEARRVGWPTVSMWGGGEWIECRATRLWKSDHLFTEADQAKLTADVPHVIESPPACTTCEMWGGKPNLGGCSLCTAEK